MKQLFRRLTPLRTKLRTTAKHNHTDLPKPLEIEFPPKQTKIPLVLWAVGIFGVSSTISGIKEQLDWDPKDSVRSASAGGTWGTKRQMQGLVSLTTVMGTTMMPFASWDVWGKVCATDSIGKICEKGLASPDAQTRTVTHQLLDTVLFKYNGLASLGAHRASFRKLIRALLAQVFPADHDDDGPNATEKIFKADARWMEECAALKIFSEICMQLSTGEGTSSGLEDDETVWMRDTVVKLLNRKDKVGATGLQKLSTLLQHKTQHINQYYSSSSSSSFQDYWSVQQQALTLDHLIVCIGALSNIPSCCDNAHGLHRSLSTLHTLCSQTMEDDTLLQVDPFLVLKTMKNIVTHCQDRRQLHPAALQYIHEQSNTVWDYLSLLTDRNLSLADDLTGAACFGFGWGVLRGAIATAGNHRYRGGRVLAVGRVGLLSSLGACLLTSAVHVSKDLHRRIRMESDVLVLSTFVLERCLGVGLLWGTLRSLSPYSFLPALLVMGIESDENGGGGGVGGGEDGGGFSFRYEWSTGGEGVAGNRPGGTRGKDNGGDGGDVEV